MNKEIKTTTKKVKEGFENYFSMTKNKSFKQFYHDWHGKNMYKPFSELVEYFSAYSSKEEFQKFCESYSSYVEKFNNDDNQADAFSVKEFSKTNDGRLRKIANSVDSFGFELRQFVFSFATPQEHNDVFGNYPVKTNMPYAYHKGLDMTSKILNHLAQNYDEISQSQDISKASHKVVDTYMRDNVFKSYAFNDEYNYESKEKAINTLKSQGQRLSLAYEDYKEDKKSSRKDPYFIQTFQEPYYQEEKQASPYRPNGFELEFYFSEKLGSKDNLVDYLKRRNNWGELYSTNKDPSVYNDESSAGVLMRDESLTPHNGLIPVEYASKIMKSKSDEDSCMQLLDSFETGYVNKLCSLHQHISTEGFDLPAYKRLVKRMMRHEDEIVGSFAAEERGNNHLLYATYISRNLSQDAKKDYPMLCAMVDICDNKEELLDMVSYGRKYKTLNLVPKHTVEFRYMNAHFNREYAQGFLQFNRDMVESAVQNNGVHYNKFLLNKYSWTNNVSNDNRTEMRDIKHHYQHSFDVYNPTEVSVSQQAKIGDQSQGRLVKNALNVTGKILVENPVRRGLLSASR
ncbi:MAG: amidoligase family protein [Alphaproteobacteria bacterium]